MRKIVMMMVFGAALCAIGVVNPNVVSAGEVVEENPADESTAAQAGEQSDGEKWDRRECVRDRREDVRDRQEDYRDRRGGRPDRRQDFRGEKKEPKGLSILRAKQGF
jgi:hypothetical protein